MYCLQASVFSWYYAVSILFILYLLILFSCLLLCN